ncbi:3-oxoacyl-[acyl-carrier-protein] synthase 3 A, chloroplastic-like protein, partial [Tanacetum coccineum]
GGFKNVLVIGTDSISRYVDWTDRNSFVLFGDAAGAILVQKVQFHLLSLKIIGYHVNKL